METANPNLALASALVEELARSGLRRAVISPGSRSTPVAIALWRQPGIECSVIVDERSAAFFALGAAQASGLPVALACTSGTAPANYHPAIAEADLSAVPLIVLGSDRPPELRGIGAGQTIDQIGLYGGSVRWFCEVGNHAADDSGLLHLRATACRAFAAASGDPRPGPVQLNLAWREPLAPVEEAGSIAAVRDSSLRGRGELPQTRVIQGEARPPASVVDELSARIGAEPDGLILAGRQTDVRLRAPIAALAAASGYPVLAEPTSQLRLGPHDRSMLIGGYDEIVSGGEEALRPGLVLRFGEMPTSKALRIWLSGLDRLEQVVVDPGHGWNEPTRTAATVLRADPIELAERLAAGLPRDRARPGAVASAWLDAERSLRRDSEPAAGTGPPFTAASVYARLATALGDGDLLYVASSMPIRDLEAHLPAGEADVLVLANRGANGIDGLISSGAGAAAATGRRTLIVTGDVGLLHDLGGLAAVRDGGGPSTVLVLENGGGRIFDRLPQKQAMPAPEFEALMTTAPGLEIERAASLFDLPHHRLGDLSALPGLIGSGGGLIEIPMTSS